MASTDNITILIEHGERPLAFPGFTERATLDTGDYSVVETAEICAT